jgi:ribosome-binding protein aMBF1 (putative translation factor)
MWPQMTGAAKHICSAGTPHTESMRHRTRNPAYRAELERLAPYEALARIVIRRRGALGLSQAELAKRMGTSHSAISRIESGQHPTTVQTLRRLAAALDTHLVVGFADEIPGTQSATANAADLVAVG